ncbi:MAG: hypothetical protein KGK08_14595 [Acidobacteriota bacterium]|nr:hypothetical protein [Acidobacteriota bacterium]
MAWLKFSFVTSDDPISTSIRAETWCDYSHVDYVLDNGERIGAHEQDGVQQRPADYAVWTARLDVMVPCTDAQKEAAEAFLRAQIGTPYDKAAIAGILVHRDWRTEGEWFCSELGMAACEACGVVAPVPINIDRITPRDLLLVLSAMAKQQEAA